MNRQQPTKWKLKVEHLMACNCNWGCPCSFESPPTYGKCEAALAYRVVEGNYGNLPLNGLKWALAAAWPGPLHERKGRGVLFLDEKAKPKEREALEAIASGKAGGPIGVFMSTITAGLEVHSSSIEFHSAGKKSRFSVPGKIEVGFEPIRNPVSGEEHLPSALLPTGMLTKKDDFYSANTFSVNAGGDGLHFDYSNRNAIFFEANWRGP